MATTDLRATGGEATAAGGGTAPGQLRRGSIGTGGVLVLSLAFAGPTVSIFFNSAPAAASAGAALPLAFLLGSIGIVLLSNSIIQFSRKLPSASFAYTFNAQGLGPRWGHMSGWLLLLGYALTTTVIYAAAAAFGSTLVQDLTGLNVSWVWFFLAAVALVLVISNRGIQITTSFSLLLVGFELAVVLALSITILIHGGADGLHAAPFLPSAPGATGSGIFLAMVFTVLSFVGFENTAVLGEESRNPRRAIPRATLAAVLALGAYYVFTSYAEVVGFGANHTDKFANFAIPFDGLAQMYWSHGLSYLIATAAVTALTAGAIASHNTLSRVLFSMGRAGALPRALARTHPTHGTPTVAILTVAVVCLVVGISVSLAVGPLNTYAYLGSFITPAIVVVYILVNVSVFRFYRRQYRDEFSVVKHAVLPFLATAVLALPLESVVWPVPPFPYILAPFIVAGWVVIGFVWMTVLGRRHPEALTGATTVWSNE